MSNLINNNLKNIARNLSTGVMTFVNSNGSLISETFMCRDVCLHRAGKLSQNGFKDSYFCIVVTNFEKSCFERNLRFLHELEEGYKFKLCKVESDTNLLVFILDKRWFKPLMFSFFTWFIRLMLTNERGSLDEIFRVTSADIAYSNKISFSTLNSAKYATELRSYFPADLSLLARNLNKILSRNKANSSWPTSTKEACYQGFCNFTKSFSKGHRERWKNVDYDRFVAARKRTKEVLANEGITITLQ